jgi:hypothetical protein
LCNFLFPGLVIVKVFFPSPDYPSARSPDFFPSFYGGKCPPRSAGVSVDGRRTHACALVAQIFRTVESQSNGLATIDAGCRAIPHHAHCDLAHDEVSRLAPRWLKETKDRNAMSRHKRNPNS